MVNAVYNASVDIFNDGDVGGVDLVNLIQSGLWADADKLQPLPDLQIQLKREVISHALDGLWKTPTSNKMWVLYENLTGTGIDCNTHSTGPQDSKNCSDEGVYYTYNFIEKGDHMGVVGYPWGGQNIKNLDLDLRVRNLTPILPSPKS